MNKYKAKRTVYKGITYHSKKEANYARQLDLLIQAGEIRSWERQVPFSLRAINGKEVCKVIIDFKVVGNDGLVWYVEIKGYETQVWKLKYKFLMIVYPDLDIRIL